MEGARAAAERGDLPQFEALMIRANRPREVVQHYKDLGKRNLKQKKSCPIQFVFCNNL